ncbi:hypothetical protein [Sodalis-like endosymbiont of Proechinophthirus fluctus]|nr:hypothetical protein [Sodalis-like endosymbiont of Proechinophthirus fluctus]
MRVSFSASASSTHIKPSFFVRRFAGVYHLPVTDCQKAGHSPPAVGGGD